MRRTPIDVLGRLFLQLLTKTGFSKLKGSAVKANPFTFLVPEVGIPQAYERMRSGFKHPDGFRATCKQGAIHGFPLGR